MRCRPRASRRAGTWKLVPIAVALAAAGLSTGCGEPAPSAPLRLLDFAAGAAFTPDPERDERRDLLVAASFPADRWRPLLSVGAETDPAQLARFTEVSGIHEDGSPVLGPARGSWLATIPIDEAGPVFLRGQLRFFGPRGGVDSRVVVYLAELTEDPGPGADSELDEALVALHGTRAADGRHRSIDLALDIDLDPRTRFLGVMCSQEKPIESGSTARVEDLHVYRPGLLDVVDLATAEGRRRLDPGEPLQGRFRIGMVSRPGLALAPGDELELPLPVPPGGGQLEAWLGLANHDVAPAGTDVRVRLSAAPAGGGARTDLGVHTLTSASAADRRWQPIAVDLPARLAGRATMLRMVVDPLEDGRASAALLPVVLAAPRAIPERIARRGPNVVVISIDTLRADHLGAYGYERPTSPSIDRLAGGGVVFEDVWAQGPYTLPTHMSLLTGQHPSVHGALRDPGSVDPVRTRMLSEVFADAGYATGAFVGGGYLLPSFGFGPGFDTYSVIDPSWNRESKRIQDFIRDADELSWELADAMTMDVVAQWIGEHADESFALFLHTYAAHEFDPPEAHRRAMGFDDLGPLDQYGSALRWLVPTVERPPTVGVEDRQVLNDLYDAAIHQADTMVGALLDTLDRLQLADDTIVVLTSDHGKEIGDHGGVGHGHTLYEELLRVPLIVRAPGIAPGRSQRPAMQVDVLPTVAALAGLQPPAAIQGEDLFAGHTEPRTMWAEVDAAAHKYAARSGSRKTIWSPMDTVQAIANRREEETFDLALDPGEQRPLSPDPNRVDAVRGYRDALVDLAESLGGTGRTTTGMSGQTRAQLEALGYTVDEPDADRDD